MTRKLLPDSDTTKTLKDFQRDRPNAKGGETRYRTREVLLPTLATKVVQSSVSTSKRSQYRTLGRVVQYGGFSIKYAYYTYFIAKIKYVRNTALNTSISRALKINFVFVQTCA